MIFLSPTNRDHWRSIEALGVSRAVWRQPSKEVRIDFKSNTLSQIHYESANVLDVYSKSLRLFSYVAHTFEKAVEVCLWDLQGQHYTQYVDVYPGSFCYARYAIHERLHHVSVISDELQVYQSYSVRADLTDDQLVAYVRRKLMELEIRMGGGR